MKKLFTTIFSAFFCILAVAQQTDSTYTAIFTEDNSLLTATPSGINLHMSCDILLSHPINQILDPNDAMFVEFARRTIDGTLDYRLVFQQDFSTEYDTLHCENDYFFILEGSPDSLYFSFRVWRSRTNLLDPNGYSVYQYSTDTVAFANPLNLVTSIKGQAQQAFIVYPNPATDHVTVVVPDGTTLNIFNISGKEVREISILDPNVLTDITKLSSGTYFVTGIDNNGNAIKPKKLIVN